MNRTRFTLLPFIAAGSIAALVAEGGTLRDVPKPPSLLPPNLVETPWSAGVPSLRSGQADTGGHPLRPLLPPKVVEARLEQFAFENDQREKSLHEMFAQAGCGPSQLSEEVIHPGRPPNLVCSLAGSTQSAIVVGAHTDHVLRGQGAVDDWSGAALLPSLYESLRAKPRWHTFLFIGFAEEEDGLVGSAYFTNHLSAQAASSIRAMVNLECLGTTPPKVWSDHADPKLLGILENVAAALRVPLAKVDLERVGRDDAESFRRHHVPTITLHSLTQETVRLLHTPRDRLSAIHPEDYYEAYQLLVAYLAALDRRI